MWESSSNKVFSNYSMRFIFPRDVNNTSSNIISPAAIMIFPIWVGGEIYTIQVWKTNCQEFTMYVDCLRIPFLEQYCIRQLNNTQT